MAIVEKLETYDWGKVLNFGVRGNGAPYCNSGWGEAEDGHVWTNSHNARLSMTVKPATSDISLFLNCAPFIAPELIDEQEIHLYVNFLRVGFAAITEQAEIEFRIPRFVFERPRCDIDIYLPLAKSPFKLGLNPDVRCLGVAVSRMVLVQS